MVLVKKKNVNGIIYLFENHVNGNLMEWSTGLLNFFFFGTTGLLTWLQKEKETCNKTH